jgi:hypothetical protein
VVPHFLNLTLPLKQDAASQGTIKAFLADFPAKYGPGVVAVLKESRMVHYCRFVVIDNRYLQVLTEYDTDFRVYTDFFADQLHDFFKLLFAVVEGAPSVDKAGDREEVYKFISKHDLPSLAGSTFAAYPDLLVPEIQKKFSLS